MKKHYLAAYNQQHLSQKIIQKKSNMRQSPTAWSGSLSNSIIQNQNPQHTNLNAHSIHKHLNIQQLQQSYGSLAGLSKTTADDKTQITSAETAMSSGFVRTGKLQNTKSMQLLP